MITACSNSDSLGLPTLRVDGVNRRFDSGAGQCIPVLQGITFEAKAGEFLVVRGPNGCGKSTLMNLLAGLDTPSGGRVFVNQGHSSQASVGYLFQDYSGSLLPWMTLGENTTLPLKLKGISRSQRRDILFALADDTGLAPLPFDHYPFQCSGGQQQKTCFLRSLLASETFLILDEPFASLDRNSRGKIIERLNKLHASARALVLLVLHDLDDAILLADRILCLDGSPATIRDDVPVNLPWPREPAMRVESQFLYIRRRVLESFGELGH
jgi:ABC-type nitrate/sulfonate/bicarbonate transport system ATPase subunit